MAGDPPMTGVLALYVEHAKGLRSSDTSEYHALRLGAWAIKYKASQAREFSAHVIKDMSAFTAALAQMTPPPPPLGSNIAKPSVPELAGV